MPLGILNRSLTSTVKSGMQQGLVVWPMITAKKWPFEMHRHIAHFERNLTLRDLSGRPAKHDKQAS